MEPFAVYKDIQARTKGQFLLGVVGPVRTGKSTFIRRFMELLALPGMEELGTDAVFYQLFDGFSENIGLPDALSS